MRLVNSDADRSYMNGGLGSTRFDRDDAALELGRARFALTQALGETWSAHLDASVWDDKDAHPLGLTEAYLQFRPYPQHGLRLRVKTGAFYPPVSLENRAGGWESPYTVSFSAINSWFATEVRTLGAEAQLDWLGSRTGHTFDLGLTLAVFGWNDQAGAVLAGDGFVLTDRQIPLAGRVGRPDRPPLHGGQPFLETDGRPGAYAGLEARCLDRLTLRVLRYDNRADRTQIDTVAGAIAWRHPLHQRGRASGDANGWTCIAQWLDGRPPSIRRRVQTLAWPFHVPLRAAVLPRESAYPQCALRSLLGRLPHPEATAPPGGHAWTPPGRSKSIPEALARGARVAAGAHLLLQPEPSSIDHPLGDPNAAAARGALRARLADPLTVAGEDLLPGPGTPVTAPRTGGC